MHNKINTKNNNLFRVHKDKPRQIYAIVVIKIKYHCFVISGMILKGFYSEK